jgi:hypothetical protein
MFSEYAFCDVSSCAKPSWSAGKAGNILKFAFRPQVAPAPAFRSGSALLHPRHHDHCKIDHVSVTTQANVLRRYVNHGIWLTAKSVVILPSQHLTFNTGAPGSWNIGRTCGTSRRQQRLGHGEGQINSACRERHIRYPGGRRPLPLSLHLPLRLNRDPTYAVTILNTSPPSARKVGIAFSGGLDTSAAALDEAQRAPFHIRQPGPA